ncbi:MAG: SDR family NAD(P)-dependent oxidoreductase, partial [Acidobacteria bacterium]|nr:SDR family NAD(P)-dependent oxidoreductase [Acidobacteriota bacterium]
MSVDWSKRVVFITGASSGIGRGLSLELARKGASMGLLARRREMLEGLVAEVEKAGGRAMALPADVTEAAAVKRAADNLRGQFGRIDVLIANAGVGATTHAKDLKADE